MKSGRWTASGHTEGGPIVASRSIASAELTEKLCNPVSAFVSGLQPQHRAPIEQKTFQRRSSFFHDQKRRLDVLPRNRWLFRSVRKHSCARNRPRFPCWLCAQSPFPLVPAAATFHRIHRQFRYCYAIMHVYLSDFQSSAGPFTYQHRSDRTAESGTGPSGSGYCPISKESFL